MLFSGDLLDRKILNASNARHRRSNLFSQSPQCFAIFAEDFYCDLSVDPRNQLVVSRLNDLRKVEPDARKGLYPMTHRVDQIVFRFGGGPSALRLEANI